MISFLRKHIEYNYYDYTFIGTLEQNHTITISVMQIKGSLFE